jgi:hypothetical protein
MIIVHIEDIDRASVYVSLAPDMEHPMGVDLPMDNAARCYRYTSSDEDANQAVPDH